ncbi:MAG TPA: GatB/YqeY domain-containing protein [Nitrospiria bacterium]|nr:GatB/YqeY domain-containing protein [Nitrospiria bacterium]
MPLQERLINEMKEAMRSGDKNKVSVIRMVRSSLKNKEIEKGKGKALSDEEVIQVIVSSVRQRRDSIEEFKKGGRQDLVDKEEVEIRILQTFLPGQLAIEELVKIIKETIEEVKAVGIKDMGQVMKILVPKIVGKADPASVSKIVKEILTKTAGG